MATSRDIEVIKQYLLHLPSNRAGDTGSCRFYRLFCEWSQDVGGKGSVGWWGRFVVLDPLIGHSNMTFS